MHPIISAAIAEQRHADLLRSAARDRQRREVPRPGSEEQRRGRIPAAALLLRGWLVRG
ncbi:MAG TPA: hypothetical protein VFT67_00785 [Jatrophihabitantaceae bacterium]|jgi:hypothetical protein|nr:hypothetical protein [Jatrophihabitantaceae bacterium]